MREYEAPKYLPGEKVQIGVKYVKLADFVAKVGLFYPFLIKVIQTDSCFECRLYGYLHYLIPPAYPRANSHVERTHRVDKEEVYNGKTFKSLTELAKVNLTSLKYFNENRPQKSKHFMSPLQFGIIKFKLTKQKLNYAVLYV